MSGVRGKAAAIVTELAARLADPSHVERVSLASQAAALVAGAPPKDVMPWSPGSLNGHAGVALLHAELAQTDPRHRPVAHRYLSAAAIQQNGEVGVHCGLSGLAFASLAARRDPREYSGLLRQIDEHVHEYAMRLVETEDERFGQEPPAATAFQNYDVISGLAGIGRYALARLDTDPKLAERIAETLTRLARPCHVAGYEVPGWWAGHSPLLDPGPDGRYTEGHLNLGLAHGIAGPLALLAVGWRLGVRVPGQREAIEHFVQVLEDTSVHDDQGAFWPGCLSLADYRGVTAAGPERLAWCYGSPGVARSVQLAGLALERVDWVEMALAAARAAFARPEPTWGIADAALCHGLAGLLQIITRITADSPDAELEMKGDQIAERMVESFQPDVAFGYCYAPARGISLDEPGLLNGAAGVALALHGYASGRLPAAGWDSVLLLA